MQRHAYLLMIHENTLVLQRLISLLDYEYNDIFIHIDKNSKSINCDEIKSWVKVSKIYFTKRYKVYWGTNSITLAEIALLKRAVLGEYDYYHLLSGADLPIKPQQEIHKFFENYAGKEFIHFGTEQYQRDIAGRYTQYHFFAKQLGRKRDKKFWCDMETYSLAIQRRLHVDRTNKISFSFYGGANWFSITSNLAQYIVKNYGKYAKSFRNTQNSDELLVQTICMDSPYKKNLYLSVFADDYRACMHYVDWKRGNPYVFKLADYEALLHSEYMFARKFDERTDRDIVEKIYHALIYPQCTKSGE